MIIELRRLPHRKIGHEPLGKFFREAYDQEEVDQIVDSSLRVTGIDHVQNKAEAKLQDNCGYNRNHTEYERLENETYRFFIDFINPVHIHHKK
jgi:hypothetical protein